jgi:hypothetical protein
MARFDNGWIAVSRDMAFGDIAQRGPDTLWVWVRILTMANWKESSAYLKGQQLRLQPGQLVTGLAELAGDHLSIKAVRNALSYLERTGRIGQAAGNHGRVITICNWEKYQNPDFDETSNGQATGKQGASNGQHSEQGTINKITSASAATPQVRKRKVSPEVLQATSIDQVLTSISLEQISTWSKLYPDEEFRKRTALRAWEYYKRPRNARKAPTTIESWIAVLEYWFNEDWPKHVRAIPGGKVDSKPSARAPIALSDQGEAWVQQVLEARAQGGLGLQNAMRGMPPKVAEMVEISFGTWRSIPTSDAEREIRAAFAMHERQMQSSEAVSA